MTVETKQNIDEEVCISYAKQCWKVSSVDYREGDKIERQQDSCGILHLQIFTEDLVMSVTVKKQNHKESFKGQWKPGGLSGL